MSACACVCVRLPDARNDTPTRTAPTNACVHKRPHPETSHDASQRLATCTGLQNGQPCQVGPIRAPPSPPPPPARAPSVPGDRRGQTHLPTPSKVTSIAASASRAHSRAIWPRGVMRATPCAYVGDVTPLDARLCAF